MIKNYLVIALRNFWRNKVFSIINIAGLSIGISAALVIYLIVHFEFSYEKFHKDSARIYRVVSESNFNGTLFKNGGVPMPMPEAVRNDLAGIETVAHFVTLNETKVSVPFAGSQSPAEFKNQEGLVFADEFYFSLFSYDWLAGSQQTALKDPVQVVLTESRAKAYFGNTQPADIIGRTIIYFDTIRTTVAGIVKDLDEKATDFRFKEFLSLATISATALKENYGYGPGAWSGISSDNQLFIKLKKGVKPKNIEAQFPAFRKKYIKEETGVKDDETNYLQPIADIHFNAAYDTFGPKSSRSAMYGLLAVAIFLLSIGCINFINLTTARSSLRAKEIGIRKTSGSSKTQLIIQFLSETFVFTIIAAALSILIMPWLLNIFKDFIPAEINMSSIDQPHVWYFFSILIIIVTVLSGFYPAWILTKYQPVAVLKGQGYAGQSKTSKAWLRKTLTVTQFVIAQFLIIATLIVVKQIHYSLNKDLGYKKDAIVYFNVPFPAKGQKKDDRRYVLLEKMKAMPEIEVAGLGSTPPAFQGSGNSGMKVFNGKKVVEIMVEEKKADPSYFDVYKMKLLAGRWPAQSDTLREYVINETYVRELGLSDPQQAVGLYVDKGRTKIPIVGVMGDFNTKSTHIIIKPLAYSSAANSSYFIHVALKPHNADSWKNALAKTEQLYKALYPGNDFSYTFFDENIAAFYKSEQDTLRLLKWATGLCIFISCLGLLGLVIYITNTRTKEIGVRKVLGASVMQLVSLLSKDLVSLVIIAFLIAVPLAWWITNKWLQDFAYRTSLSWWVFAASGIGMILVAIIILSIRTIRSAMANPVKSLRME